jgi:hypothetical protein
MEKPVERLPKDVSQWDVSLETDIISGGAEQRLSLTCVWPHPNFRVGMSQTQIAESLLKKLSIVLNQHFSHV